MRANDPRLRTPSTILLVVGITCLAVGGCAAMKTSRMLMPTPLGLTLGLPHPGGDFSDSCACSKCEIPVFVVSGRSLREDSDSDMKRVDPFGNSRSQYPNLGIAYVKIGDGLSAAEVHEETITDRKRKKARVELLRTELVHYPCELEPWLVRDDVIRHDGNPWVQAIEQQFAKSGERKVCIFVHGYNTQYVDNTLLAAEIFHYLGRRGAMISFEWPSESRLLGYIADKGNASYSTRHFRAMLSNIAKECHVDSVTIVAHSAGSPIVVNAMREIRMLDYDLPPQQLREKYKIDRVVLAAPDMDLSEFLNAIYDRFYEVANGIAVYASPNDRALKISQELYGNKRLGRAVGKLEAWEQAVIGSARQIEMVDASKAEKMYDSFIGHSYFHRDPWVSSDIGAFILGRSPGQRGLQRQQDDVFWRFPTDYPDRLKRLATARTSSPELR